MIPLEELELVEVLAGIGPFTLCTNDPPWSGIAARVATPSRVIIANDLALEHLEALIEQEPDSAVVVGLGGGSALDTAKFVAWKTGKRLLQIPTITSVDAAFTDAIGVRVGRRVQYIGRIVPERVLLDVDLVRSAPARLNRAGVGDVLSCHTALYDWRLATRRGVGAAWDESAALLARSLLRELNERADEIRHVSSAAIRWLASAYQRIGAACSMLRHSRFEEGSEHFLAYAYEHRTGKRPLHGEIVALGVLAMSTLQENDPGFVRDVIAASGILAHPSDVDVQRDDFIETLRGLAQYVVAERLDHSCIDEKPIDARAEVALWEAISSLPRGSRLRH